MLNTKWIDILPEKIPDEAAYYLVNFFIELTTLLETHYFAQMRRHVTDNLPPTQDYNY